MTDIDERYANSLEPILAKVKRTQERMEEALEECRHLQDYLRFEIIKYRGIVDDEPEKPVYRNDYALDKSQKKTDEVKVENLNKTNKRNWWWER